MIPILPLPSRHVPFVPRPPVLAARRAFAPVGLAAAAWLLIAAGSSAELPAQSAVAEREAQQFFEREVRPLLAEHCHRCHGAKKQQGSLRLDSRGGAMGGGDSGPAVVPGKPAESLLLEAVRYESLEMPPDRQLDAGQIAVLERWIAAGAAWPGDTGAVPPQRDAGFEITDLDRGFWSFQPRAAVRPPRWEDSATRPTNGIDSLVADRLGEQSLRLAPPAEPRTLVRRLYLDLIGLPPTKEQVDAFLADESPVAYERLVDELLARPQYGERWGRHWLDVVRFGQTNGYERDAEKPLAWRYRDYVIRAWNEDKPFDRFLREQLAGDQMQPVTDDGLTATAFYRLGVWDDEPDDRRQAEFDNLDDMLTTMTSAMLGLTVGCARCHDHKFDPLPQEDYYRLLAFLRDIAPYTNPGDKRADGTIFATLESGEKTLAAFDHDGPPKPTHVLVRGSADNPGARVSPGFPQVLVPASQASASLEPGSAAATDSAATVGEEIPPSRVALADWVADERNPLTARVIVNRLWQHHFGQGIVPTPNDFGRTGIAPSHPRLLDYLANELIRHEWRIKPIQRLIVSSRTYRQSSRAENARAATLDPDNRLLWRQNLRRLEAEAIRDSVLAASGELNLNMGGRGIFPRLNPQVLATQSRPGNGWDRSEESEQCRRSVYIFVKRTLRVPLLETFDAASPDTTIASRTTTTIAPQALILLNSRFMRRRAEAMARRVRREAGDDPRRQIQEAFRIALARDPTAVEQQVALEFHARQKAEYAELLAADPSLVQADASLASSTLPTGWTAFGGRWTVRADGGLEVAPASGAKALWQSETLADGEVRAQVLLRDRSGDAGLLLRVSDPREGTDALHGYNINFQGDQLRLGKHRDNWKALAHAACPLERNAWHDVRVLLEGGRIRIYLGEAAEPRIDYTDPEPLAGGRIGFRTFHAAAAVRNIRWKSAAGEGAAAIGDPPDSGPRRNDPAEQFALASLCRLLLNLNEFVYVD